MLKETGTVIAVDHDGLWVETLKQSTCAKCAVKSGCGQQLMSKLSPSSHSMTLVKAIFSEYSANDVWEEGDQVILGVNESALVLAALLAYGVPLVGLIVGALVGERFGFLQSNDMSSLFGAIVGLLCGGAVVKFHSRFVQDKSVFHAYVLGRAIGISQ